MSALGGRAVVGRVPVGRVVAGDWAEVGDCVAGVPYAYCPARTSEVGKRKVDN